MRLMVGSAAAKFWFRDFREPKDVDYFVTEPTKMDPMGGKRVECFHHPVIANWMNEKMIDNDVASPEFLYTLKVSHAFWALRNRSWSKHMHDVLFFQERNVSFNSDLYDMLYGVWEEVHGKKKANLNKSPEEFFTNTVERLYDHDSIHRSVAYHDSPMFERILRDGAAVAVSRAKFDALSHEEKCQLVREEVYATALERIIIPSDYTRSPRGAYHWALCKTVTSFSKGWFPLWIVLNYGSVKEPDVDFVQRHRDNADRLILLEA